MSDLDGLTAKLIKQQKQLRSVIADAESKVDVFLQTIVDGREHLKKVEDMLKTMRKN